MDSESLFGVILFVLITVLIFAFVLSNVNDCYAKSCPEGMEPAYVHHQCLCVTRPK